MTLAQRYDLNVAVLRIAIESTRFIESEKIHAVSIDIYEAILAAWNAVPKSYLTELFKRMSARCPSGYRCL
jgi:hypothetical protein